tara:strand:- start:1843 stop:3867 length:2025 start_codon:yes stop_codon:yes gene_type:complete
MFIAILTLLSALSISGVAIFYSVIGLATIFPGAFWPVVIMGSVLEVGKLVTASWLYRNWKQTRFLLKTYLTIAVVVLSLITSMGIFGFLSKAHLEQNLAEDTVTQRIEIINSKIVSEETYIKRQNNVIARLEKSLNKTSTSNKDAIELEQQSLKDVQDKFKTLLTVETNTVKNLNERMAILDRDVSDVLTTNKSFFNEEKAAADLKASQKEERALIELKISEAQGRIAILKQDYAEDTKVIQSRIDLLRSGNTEDKTEVNEQIEKAENNILKAQNNIDDLIVEREPLQAKMIKLEAEVGPVKYIAALVVDWGVTQDVDTAEAVRWVILIIIFVFDPLAVLLLVAANQSLLRRFPVKPLKPQEIVDLEKPDDEDITLKWNEAMVKANAHAKMEEATNQLREWKQKLDQFNSKVEKPEPKPLEIIQEDDSIPHIKLKGQKEPEKQTKELDNMTDGFDPAEVEGYEEFNKKYEEPTPEKIEEFKQREQKELADLQRIAEAERVKPNLTEEIKPEVAVKEPDTTTVEEALKMPESESVVKPIEQKQQAGMLGTRVVNKKGKVVEPPKPVLTNWQRSQLLEEFHSKHGNFEDVEDYVQNEEQDENTLWQKTKTVDVHSAVAKEQFTKYKKRVTTDTDYHSRMEQRISDLITKIEEGEIEFKDLTKEDQEVIIEILNQNG